MAKTKVDHVNLTVTTVEVFIQTMQFINEHDLWDRAKDYLEANQQTEMFVDNDAFNLFRKMLVDQEVQEEKMIPDVDPVYGIIIGHGGR